MNLVTRRRKIKAARAKAEAKIADVAARQLASRFRSLKRDLRKSNLRKRLTKFYKGGPGSGRYPAGSGEGGKGTRQYTNPKTMPSTFRDAPITMWQKGRNGVIAITDARSIGINTQSYAWKNMEEYQRGAFEKGWQSTPNPDHVILHEYAHFWGRNNNPSYDYLVNRNSTDKDFLTVASRVSQYACVNGSEFISETFAGLVYGNKYDDDVMNLYKFLGGPTP